MSDKACRLLAALAMAAVASFATAANGTPSDVKEEMLIEKANVAVFGPDDTLNVFLFSFFNVLTNISGIEFRKTGEPANIGIYYGDDIF